MAQKRIDIGFVNPVYRGEWGSTTEYKPLDMIRFNNCLYMAKVNTVDDDPDKMTVRTASYTVGDVWCANVLWLHPMRDDMTNNYVNMLTVVPTTVTKTVVFMACQICFFARMSLYASKQKSFGKTVTFPVKTALYPLNE